MASRSVRRSFRAHETTWLYGIVERNIGGCLSLAQRRSANGYGYPRFVEREFYKYLDCGMLRCGFVRVQCGDCKHDKLVAFSCKGRGLCPSCTARRMSNTAAHLVDTVLPQVPYRQWVLSFPRRVRFLLAKDAALLSAVLNMALRKLFAWQRRATRRMGINMPQTGAITFVQRFGSLLNLNVHFHSLLPDGVFQHVNNGVVFRPIPPPSGQDIERLVLQIARATEKLLKRNCEQSQPEEDLDQLTKEQAHSLRFQSAAAISNVTPKTQRCAFLQGYSLHAERIVLSDDREGLERLCRYGARAPIANSRLSLDEDGNAILELKRRYFDGRTHLKLSQVELLQKLAILMPPPWKNLTRYHGVFAPNHQLRGDVVNVGRPTTPTEEASDSSNPKPPRALPWAMLLRRVFAIDVLQCEKCEGRMKIIAIIPAGEASNAILDHLDQQTKAPPMATGPPPTLLPMT